ncbi:MAG: zinc ribbon domain-containing protein [DPANN group archaeon]|nr:zinc ribbon domain-containing protein [DPANN group archaeon]
MAEEGKAENSNEIYVAARIGGMPIEYTVTADKGIVLKDGRKLEEAFPDVAFDVTNIAQLCSKFYSAVGEAKQAELGARITALSTEKASLEERLGQLESFTPPAPPAPGRAPDAQTPEQSGVASVKYLVRVSYEGGRWPAEIKDLNPDATLEYVLRVYKEMNKDNLPGKIQHLKIALAGERSSAPRWPSDTPLEYITKGGTSLELEVYMPDLQERASDAFGTPVQLQASSGRAQKVLNRFGKLAGAELDGEFYIQSGDGHAEFYENVVTKEIAPGELEIVLDLAFESAPPLRAPALPPLSYAPAPPPVREERPLPLLPPQFSRPAGAGEAGRSGAGLESLVPKNSFDRDTRIATYVMPDSGGVIRYKVGLFGRIKVVEAESSILTHEIEKNRRQLQEFYYSELDKKDGGSARLPPPPARPLLARAPALPPLSYAPAPPPVREERPLPPSLPPAEPEPKSQTPADSGEGADDRKRAADKSADEGSKEGGAGGESDKDDEGEQFECPACGWNVSAAETKCPKCGVEFEEA